MKNFVETVKEEYDMVLFDTSPVCAVTDAAILSTIVDATILVVSCSQTRIETARKAKEMLDKVRANVIGVVINKMVGAMEEGYSYYYYGEKKERK